MCIQYIEAEFEPEPERPLAEQVEALLAGDGEPLRWAIVEAPSELTLRVEAVVCR